jgi:thiamine pyrophosphokinase
MEHKYNMDPTSLCLLALELFDIRNSREEAFECFIRAWHQAHIPSATIRLVNSYLPIHATIELTDSTNDEQILQGTREYYFQCVGGSKGLAQLYLQAGLLHLDGAAAILPSSSLASLRLPSQNQSTLLQNQLGESTAEAWRRDREAAAKYFERARVLNPNLDVPVLPPDGSPDPAEGEGAGEDLLIPSVELPPISTPESNLSESIFTESDAPMPQIRRRQKKREELAAMVDEKTGLRIGERRRGEGGDDDDAAWYLYIPGLVGAGTALLVVGVVGALSLSNWRRNQG